MNEGNDTKIEGIKRLERVLDAVIAREAADSETATEAKTLDLSRPALTETCRNEWGAGNDDLLFVCSACDAWAALSYDGDVVYDFNFCPYCGRRVKMEEGGEDQ